MNAGDFEKFIKELGYTVDVVEGEDGLKYTIIRDLTITTGKLVGQTCDVGIQRCEAEPYVVPPAIHTRPHLVPMDTGSPLATQQSKIGPEWQYWSRRFERVPTPKSLWAHILTILGEVR